MLESLRSQLTLKSAFIQSNLI